MKKLSFFPRPFLGLLAALFIVSACDTAGPQLTQQTPESTFQAALASELELTDAQAAKLPAEASRETMWALAAELQQTLTDDQKANINKSIPAGRMGASDDIAHAVVYLASEEAGYMTGQTLHVNGGMAMI